MLRERVITAVILLVLFLLALFLLPDAGWAALVIVMVSQGASEWLRLARFSGRKANIFWGLTLVMMLGLVWFDAYHTPEQQALPHVLVYALSLIHISEPTRLGMISYAVFCLKKKKKNKKKKK